MIKKIKVVLKTAILRTRLRKIQQIPPVFVYTVGKVGSTSISRSLLNQYDGVVVHGHGFSADNYSPYVRELYAKIQLSK